MENGINFIYVGSLKVCESGAIGTHTRGILKAALRNEKIKSVHILGNDLSCLEDLEDSLIIRNVNHTYPESGGVIQKFFSLVSYAKLLAASLETLLAETDNNDNVVYHRYHPIISNILLRRIKRMKANYNLTSILEYNDITEDQLKFAKEYNAWGRLGNFIRTNPLTIGLLKKLEKAVFKSADKVLAMTDGIREYILKLQPAAKVIVSPNATDIDLINRFKYYTKRQARRDLGLPEGYFYLIHVGTVTYWDGLDYLLKAVYLAKHKDKIRVIIIGSGQALDLVRKTIAGLDLSANASIHPPMPHEEAIKYAIAADAIPLLKTIASYQVCPIKYYESLGLGKTLLVTDIPYINEIGKLELGKVLQLPLRSEELAGVIDGLIEEGTGEEGARMRIIDYAAGHHTWDKRLAEVLSGLKFVEAVKRK